MSEDELDNFRKQMSDVTPIRTQNRVVLKPRPDQSPGLDARRQAAVSSGEKDRVAPLSLEHIPPVDPHDILGFVRPGVQQGVYKKLRLGKYSIDARLDLHRMNKVQARNAILQFMGDCMHHEVRCALITHGKGEGRQEPAMLKSCVACWLPDLPEVLAFHSAMPQHGGSGAVYLLLRKSEKKRQENWERHIGRRA